MLIVEAKYEIYQIEVADWDSRREYQHANKGCGWYANNDEHKLYRAYLVCKDINPDLRGFISEQATILVQEHPRIGDIHTIELSGPVKP